MPASVKPLPPEPGDDPRPLPHRPPFGPADAGKVMEEVIIKGDLGKLTDEQRARYYVAVCESIGLNPLTQPFQYLRLDDRLTLYPTKGAADQLRGLHKIETRIVSRETAGGVHTVVVEARGRDGRTETDIGVVPIQGLAGAFLANALMKAVTKAKRRVTLAMLGLPFLDEDDLRTVRGARVVPVDAETGEILDPGPAAKALAATNGDDGEPVAAGPETGSPPPTPPRPAPKPPAPGGPPDPPADPAPPKDRGRRAEADGLLKDVAAVFGVGTDEARAIATELLRNRWGVDDTRWLTTDQVADVRDAVLRWRAAAGDLRQWLAMLDGVTTATMLVDAETVLAERGVDDPLLLGALATRRERIEGQVPVGD